jgi:hypothetical protein
MAFVDFAPDASKVVRVSRVVDPCNYDAVEAPTLPTAELRSDDEHPVAPGASLVVGVGEGATFLRALWNLGDRRSSWYAVSSRGDEIDLFLVRPSLVAVLDASRVLESSATLVEAVCASLRPSTVLVVDHVPNHVGEEAVTHLPTCFGVSSGVPSPLTPLPPPYFLRGVGAAFVARGAADALRVLALVAVCADRTVQEAHSIWSGGMRALRESEDAPVAREVAERLSSPEGAAAMARAKASSGRRARAVFGTLYM